MCKTVIKLCGHLLYPILNVTLLHRLARHETNLCAVAYTGIMQDVFCLQEHACFPLVTMSWAQLTNQCKGKQCSRIFADIHTLYGHKAEASLTDYFLKQKWTNVQSASMSGSTDSPLNSPYKSRQAHRKLDQTYVYNPLGPEVSVSERKTCCPPKWTTFSDIR